MTDRVLSLRELNRAALARQLLLGRAPLSPIEVIERLVGMQAQWPQSPYVGIWTRTTDFQPAALAAEVLDELYRPVVAAAAASGLAVEVSSSTLRQPSAEVTPAPALLAMFRGAGVPITLASDAHVPDLVGHAHDQVVAAARAAGYDSYLRFAARQRIVLSLPGD